MNFKERFKLAYANNRPNCKIYENSDDVHVAKTCVYVDISDKENKYVYLDRGLTQKIDGPTLHELFLKGMVVIDHLDNPALNYYVPIQCILGDVNGEGWCAVAWRLVDGDSETGFTLSNNIEFAFSSEYKTT